MQTRARGANVSTSANVQGVQMSACGASARARAAFWARTERSEGANLLICAQ